MSARRIPAPLTRFWQGLAAARQHWAARRELGQLDDRMLKDLGISRAQAEFIGRSRSVWHIGPHHDA